MFARLSPYGLWVLVSLPALWVLNGLATTPDIRALMQPTGTLAARFLIVTLLATPLMILLPGWRGPRWLAHNRRIFGIATFGYSALHLSIYLADRASVPMILAHARYFEIWTGWLAFAIFLPLAATSSDRAIRRLGPHWKPLQRLTYAAAVLVLLHWASQHDWSGWVPALLHFAPLGALELFRLWHIARRRKSPAK